MNTLQAQANGNYVRRLLKEKQARFAALLESAAWESALNAKYPDGAPGTGAQQRNAMACAIKEDTRPGTLGGRWIRAARRRYDHPPRFAAPTGRANARLIKAESRWGCRSA